MRRALVGLGALLVIGSALPMVTATADNSPGSGLGSFGLNAIGTGVQLRVGEPSFCFTSAAGRNGCEGAFPEATSSLQSGPNGSSLASVLWPGDLGANAGSLIVTASNGQAPAGVSMLDSPIRAERRTGQSPDTQTNNSTPPGSSMKAVARSTLTSADATVASTGVPVGTFGPSHATARTEVTGPKAAVSQATSNVQDIDLAGVVHIGAVQSSALATTDGTTAKVKGSTKVTGATIAGVPVTIDESGVSVNGSGLALKALTAQVNAALAQAGLTLMVSEPQGKPDGASVTYSSGGLVAVFAPQAGYQFSLIVGEANVTAASVEAITFTPPTFGGTTSGGTTGLGTTGTTGGGSTSGTGGLSGVPGTTGSVPTTTGGGAVPPPQTLTPQLSAKQGGLYGGVSPWLGAVGLGGVGMMLAGMRRLPDKVLVPVPPACPLEES